MLCSAKELGLGQDHSGILELATDAAPGTRFVDVVPVADHQIVIDVPASRPDLLCHKGVARELAASLGGVVKLPEIPSGQAVRRSVDATDRPPVRLTGGGGAGGGGRVSPQGAGGWPRCIPPVSPGVPGGASPAPLACPRRPRGQPTADT